MDSLYRPSDARLEKVRDSCVARTRGPFFRFGWDSSMRVLGLVLVSPQSLILHLSLSEPSAASYRQQQPRWSRANFELNVQAGSLRNPHRKTGPGCRSKTSRGEARRCLLVSSVPSRAGTFQNRRLGYFARKAGKELPRDKQTNLDLGTCFYRIPGLAKFANCRTLSSVQSSFAKERISRSMRVGFRDSRSRAGRETAAKLGIHRSTLESKIDSMGSTSIASKLHAPRKIVSRVSRIRRKCFPDERKD
jgi:hypothetical protein